jgi:hypothetical protein
MPQYAKGAPPFHLANDSYCVLLGLYFARYSRPDLSVQLELELICAKSRILVLDEGLVFMVLINHIGF